MADTQSLRLDLTKAAKRLGNDRKYRGVIDAIAMCSTAYAAEMDLRQAESLMGHFLQLVGGTPTYGEQSVHTAEKAGALFKMAVILYARATTDGSDSRRKLDFVSALNGDDKRRHDRILTVRSRAIAHIDRPHRVPRGPWVEDDLVLDLGSDGLKSLRYFYRRTNYRQHDVADLQEALAVALGEMSKIRETLTGKVIGFYEKLQGDNKFMSCLDVHEFAADQRSRWTVLRPAAPDSEAGTDE